MLSRSFRTSSRSHLKSRWKAGIRMRPARAWLSSSSTRNARASGRDCAIVGTATIGPNCTLPSRHEHSLSSGAGEDCGRDVPASDRALPPADLQVVGLRKIDGMIRLRGDLVVEREARAERLAHGPVELRALDPARAAGGDQRAAGADLTRG